MTGFSAGLLNAIPAPAGAVDARGVRRRRGPRAEPESIPRACAARWRSLSGGHGRGGEQLRGRRQAEGLAWPVVDLAAIRTTSDTVWTLRSVPFGK